MRLGPSGVGLDDGGIAKTVDDHTGQAVRLGMDQAVMRRVVQAFAQRQSGGQAGGEPRLINLGQSIAVQHTRDDFGFGVDGHKPNLAPLAIFQHGQSAGGQRGRAPVRHQLVGVNPRKAQTHSAGFGLGAQAHHGAGMGTACGGRGGGGLVIEICMVAHKPPLPASPPFRKAPLSGMVSRLRAKRGC